LSNNGSNRDQTDAEKQFLSGCINDGMPSSPHTFHIPVMGTGFTVDTPLKVARYGISSVLSIGDDILLENMRKYHCKQNGLTFNPIAIHEQDFRARRITAYLDLLADLVIKQVQALRREPFEPGSDITRYFEMLPDSPLKKDYLGMLKMADSPEKTGIQNGLRSRAVPGSIDVNIMTKIDGDRFRDGMRLPPEEAVAMSALRGFAKSRLRSSIILSAGLNRRLFVYMAGFEDFFPDGDGYLKKRIVLKVSDFRSAFIQGQILASLGLWVSEYRIESGVNCGGHAFAAKGFLMGPILEEFRQKKPALIEELHRRFRKALSERGRAWDRDGR